MKIARRKSAVRCGMIEWWKKRSDHLQKCTGNILCNDFHQLKTLAKPSKHYTTAKRSHYPHIFAVFRKAVLFTKLQSLPRTTTMNESAHSVQQPDFFNNRCTFSLGSIVYFLNSKIQTQTDYKTAGLRQVVIVCLPLIKKHPVVKRIRAVYQHALR